MIRIIIKEFFYVLTGALAVFSLLELIFPGIVISHFNLNRLLILWAADAILWLGIKSENYGQKKENS